MSFINAPAQLARAPSMNWVGFGALFVPPRGPGRSTKNVKFPDSRSVKLSFVVALTIGATLAVSGFSLNCCTYSSRSSLC